MTLLAYNAVNTIRVILWNANNQPITGVAYNASGLAVYISKAGGAPTQKSLTSTNWREIGGGIYEITLSATDCNTPGALTGWVEYPDAVNYPFEYLVTARGVPTGVQTKTYSLKDPEGEPIVGATVKIAMVIDSGVTNQNGQVTFVVPTGGEFYLVSSHPNYSFPAVDVEVT